MLPHNDDINKKKSSECAFAGHKLVDKLWDAAWHLLGRKPASPHTEGVLALYLFARSPARIGKHGKTLSTQLCDSSTVVT
jgi:hypothetical protein